MRYRKPSLKTLFGITKAKRRAKKSLGIYNVTKYINAPRNLKSRLKRKTGYYSSPMRFLRFLFRLMK